MTEGRMRGLVLINAYSRNGSMLHQAERIAGELGALGVDVEVRRNDAMIAVVSDGGIRIDGDYDFCVFLDKDRYTLGCLERSGMPVFDCAHGIEACDDKMLTCMELAGHGFRIPRTVPGVLCYDEDAEVSGTFVSRLEGELGYPMVVKECHGSLGRGVHLAHDRDELLGLISSLKCEAHLFQEFVSESSGRDLRVMVVGGRVLGGMVRRSDDFRSNVSCGGHGEPFDVPEDLKNESVRIAEVLGLDYCGIDYLFGRDGFVVCEVNSNAFFREFERVTGINVAGAYARHIVERVKGGF